MFAKSKYFPVGAIFVLSVIHSVIFMPYFNEMNLGHDYALFLPQLLNGVFHSIQNGAFSIPWFSPAICAGVPYYADMNNVYFSLPQFLSFIMSPLSSVKLTFFIFSFLGGMGFYQLLKKAFKLEVEYSLLGAALFMFNSLFATRMMIGHLTFHPFMLMPWLAYFLIVEDENNWKILIKNSLWAALLMAYLFYGGAVNMIIPTVISITIMIGMRFYMTGEKIPWIKSALAALGTFLICFSKLNASLNLMQNFSRDFYKLPGWNSLYHVVTNIFISLFGHLNSTQIMKSYTNFQFALGEHETEYSVGLVPLAILIVYSFKCMKPFMENLKKKTSSQKMVLSFTCLLMIVPVMFNFYSEGWNSLLKTLPLIKNSSLMIRWFAVYIPIVILISLLALKKLSLSQNIIQVVMIAGVMITLVQVIVWDKSYYAKQQFRGTIVDQVWNHVKTKNEIIPIKSVGEKAGANLTFVQGESNLKCYQPFFGYRLEKLPRKTIAAGSIEYSNNGVYNFKNPACYVFPEENQCQIGDHFTTAQKEQLTLFAQYKSYEFKMPAIQKVANIVSLISVFLFLVTVIALSSVSKGKQE